MLESALWLKGFAAISAERTFQPAGRRGRKIELATAKTETLTTSKTSGDMSSGNSNIDKSRRSFKDTAADIVATVLSSRIKDKTTMEAQHGMVALSNDSFIKGMEDAQIAQTIKIMESQLIEQSG